MKIMSDKTYAITNIRKGKGNRSHIIYAELKDENNELVIAYTLEYISKRLAEIIGKL